MRNHRRGSIYIMTLGTALIVALLAAAALLAVRSQRRQINLTQDMIQARLNAQTGLEMALFRIDSNPDWRDLLASDTWDTPASTRNGSYSFKGIDAEDGDLTDSVFDPVVITATGTCGSAVQKMQFRLKIRQPGLRCLEPLAHCGSDLTFDTTIFTGDRMVSSNHDLKAKKDSQVYADAEAEHEVSTEDTSVLHGETSTEGEWPREMPDTATVLDYYIANGTPITFADLPLWGAQRIVNPSMADGTSDWVAYGGCNLTLDADESQTPWCILVDGRTVPGAGPCQDITETIQSGETYSLAADAKVVGGEMNLRVSLRVVSSGSGTQLFSTPWKSIKDSFKTVEGDVTPIWTGELLDAKWIIESETQTLSFRFDDAWLGVADTPSECRAIDRVVLSPTQNPYGDGSTNASGIYVIDCSGKPIVVKDCRILGTLVLIDQKESESQITGAIHWEPAVRSEDPSVPNLPILLSNKDISLNLAGPDLDERLVNANLNPPGIPYEGSDDSDKQDILPAILDGIIYSSKKIEIQSVLSLHGAMVSEGNMDLTEATVNATYDPVYYWYNAPPGFQAELAIDVEPGSYRQVVD